MTNGSQQEKSKSRDENHCWVKGKKGKKSKCRKCKNALKGERGHKK